MTQPRALDIPGALNIRDLGGLPTSTGYTRFGAHYRADSLHNLPAESVARLIDEANVRLVIDLRSTAEADAAPNLLAAHAAYHHVPVFDMPSGSGSGPVSIALVDLYQLFLKMGAPAFARAATLIAQAPADGAVLFHCTVGKDRTGLLAALLLSLAGVNDAAIAEDYSLSAANIAPILPAMRAQMAAIGVQIDEASFAQLMASDRETMLATLAHLRAVHGGAGGYLRSAGLNEDVLQALAARLV